MSLSKLIFLVFLIKKSNCFDQTGELRFYSCNANDFENKNELKQFIIYETDLYFIYHDKFILFKLPFSYLFSPIYIKHYSPFINELHYFKEPDQLGLLHSKVDNKFEIYLIEKFQKELKKIEFDQLIGRTEMNDQNETKIDIDKFGQINKNCNLLFVSLDFEKLIQICYSKSKTRLTHISPINGNSIDLTEKLNYSVRFSVFNDLKVSSNNLIGDLIEIDVNQQLHLTEMLITKNILKKHDNIQITFDEFFNCKLPIKRIEQIKGIIFNGETFYVFINNFYLPLNDKQLIKKNFLINQNDYEKAIDLKINYDYSNNEAISDKFKSNWLKSMKDQAYLVLTKEVFSVKFPSNPKDQLDFTKNSNLDQLRTCDHNILSIGKHLFCFEKETYYLLSNLELFKDSSPVHKQISIIFEPFLKLDEEVKFIFNYKEDSFILMVTKKYFIIKYDQIELDSEFNIKFKKGTSLTINENCLFNNIYQNCHKNNLNLSSMLIPNRNETINGTTNSLNMKNSSSKPSSSATKNSKIPLFIVLIMFIVFVLIIFIIIELFKIKLKKYFDNKKINLFKNSNAQPKTNSILIKPEIDSIRSKQLNRIESSENFSPLEVKNLYKTSNSTQNESEPDIKIKSFFAKVLKKKSFGTI